MGLACETNHIFKDLVVWTTDKDNFVVRLFMCFISEQKTKQPPDVNVVIGSLFEPLPSNGDLGKLTKRLLVKLLWN